MSPDESIRMARIKKILMLPNAGESVEDHSYVADRSINGAPL